METRGRVIGLALRTTPGGAMREVEEANAPAGGWLEGDHGGSARRGITFLDRVTWRAVNAGLGTDLPWHTRRANVCVEGLDLLALVGRRLSVGGLVVDVLSETRPCDEMDARHQGLQHALEPAGYGGVYGRIVVGGTVRVGDPIEVHPPAAGEA